MTRGTTVDKQTTRESDVVRTFQEFEVLKTTPLLYSLLIGYGSVDHSLSTLIWSGTGFRITRETWCREAGLEFDQTVKYPVVQTGTVDKDIKRPHSRKIRISWSEGQGDGAG